MNPFKSYAFTWWQIGILKLALLAMGCAIGAYWHEFFGSIMTVLIVIAVASSIYMVYVTLRQQ